MEGDGQRAGWLLREVQFGKQTKLWRLRACSRRLKGFAPGKPKYRQNLLIPAFCVVFFKQKPHFLSSALATMGASGARALNQGKYSLDRHPGDRPQHAQLLHSQLIFTHPHMDRLLGA